MSRSVFVLFIAISFIILAVRWHVFFTTKTHLTDGHPVKFVGRLLDISQEDGGRQRFSLMHPSGDRIYVTTSRFTEYGYGERLLITGVIKESALGKVSIYTLSYPEIRQTQHHTVVDRFYLGIGEIQQRISTIFQRYLSPTHASLLTGIVFGIKDNLPREFKDDLEKAGVIHVIAASGMNVIMVGAFAFSLFALFLRRRNAIVASILLLCVYAVFAGLAPSIVRATIMAIVAFGAGFLGRQYFCFIALFLTGYFMLLWNPMFLRDIGFQLSFLATLGILFVRPMEQALGLVKVKPKSSGVPLADDLKITLAAQAATLPILLGNFGEYGLLSVPVNLLVLWTIPYLMVLGGFSAIISLAVSILSVPVLYLSYPLLMYFETIVSFFGRMEMQVRVAEFPLPLMIVYYGVLAVVMLAIAGRKKGT